MDRILLVEDEKETAEMIANFLRRRAYIVDIVHTLPEGMEKFSREHRLVLLDIVLEGETSFALLEKIKEESPQTAVIMVSAYDNDANIKEAKRLGADGFIHKPFKNEHLEHLLLSKIHSFEKRQTEE
ncbi:MAG: response regulator [Candidatus Omnitrophota bacterium]|nr:MAG: response regulator [Candidatus Omnitrophota bacterium]